MTSVRFPTLPSLAPDRTFVAGDRYLVYFGTCTGGHTDREGIYVAAFDSATGTLDAPHLAAEAANPGFLAIHPSQKYLYAIGDRSNAGMREGDVMAFKVTLPEGKLTRINQVSSMGRNPCHITMDRTGRMAMVANYSSGSVTSYRIHEDGSLSEAISFHQHIGSSINPERQEGPHAHSVNVSPDNRMAFACDLGTDTIEIYTIDPATGRMEPGGSAAVPSGGGPRHLAFHPDGRFVFVNNELSMTVTSFSYDANRGTLTPIATVPTLSAANRHRTGLSTAEIAVHPNGRFIYVSNRGADTIAVFSCEEEIGKLELIQNTRCEGRTPRHFHLDPTGKWCLIAHQDSHSIAVFAVDPVTGKFKFTGQMIAVRAPICVQFFTPCLRSGPGQFPMW
jgi:6-phosphogluconolactonase